MCSGSSTWSLINESLFSLYNSSVAKRAKTIHVYHSMDWYPNIYCYLSKSVKEKEKITARESKHHASINSIKQDLWLVLHYSVQCGNFVTFWVLHDFWNSLSFFLLCLFLWMWSIMFWTKTSSGLPSETQNWGLTSLMTDLKCHWLDNLWALVWV